MIKLIDSHTHIYFPQFAKDNSETINRAVNDNIGMINVGVDIESSKTAVQLAQQYKGKMWASIGIHPNDVIENFPMFELEALIQKEGVVAVGESGLDFYRTKEKEKQVRQYDFFEKHIELANKNNKPMTIHIREAYKEAIDFLASHGVIQGGAMHCFSGSIEEAREFLNLGFHISFAGNITYNAWAEEIIRFVPLDKILVETDAPFLAPVPHRGRRNEPAYVEFIARHVANIKGVSFEEISEKTTKNSVKLFGLLI